MTGDVIINTELNIDDILELEDQQQDFQAVYLMCYINHDSHSLVDARQKISRHWCDAMPSDDANSLILDMDMS